MTPRRLPALPLAPVVLVFAAQPVWAPEAMGSRWARAQMAVARGAVARTEEQEGAPLGERALALLGWAMARFWGIRQLSLAVARMIDRGGAPATESALVKEMATRFEQDVIHAVSELVDTAPALASVSLLQRLLAGSILAGPSYTIRGGTNEVLIGVVAKGLR